MKNKLEPGDKVAFLDEKGSGVVVAIAGDTAVVRMDNGLEIPFPAEKLVRYITDYTPTPQLLPPAAQKQAPKEKKTETPPTKKTGTDNTADWEAKPRIPKVKDKSFTVDPLKIGEAKPRKKSAGKEDDTWEIDLHIEELVDDYRHLTNGEILDIQLQYFRRFMDAARRNRIRRIIVIHGVGKGRLRNELYALLHTADDLEVFDAPYKDYGQGATEIRLYYGGKKY